MSIISCEPSLQVILGTLRWKANRNYESSLQASHMGFRRDPRWSVDIASLLWTMLLWAEWTWTRQHQLGQEPGPFRGSKDVPLLGCQIWSGPYSKMKNQHLSPLYLVISPHLGYIPHMSGSAFHNLDIFARKGWKLRTITKGIILPVDHGKFSWQRLGLLMTLAPVPEPLHTGLSAARRCFLGITSI